MDNGIHFVNTIEPETWKPLKLSKVFILYTYRTGCSWIFTGTELAGLVYRQCGIFDSKEHAEEALFKFPDVLSKCTGDVPSFTRACIKEVALGKLGDESGKVWFYRHCSIRSKENPLKYIDRFDPIDNDPDCPTVLLGGNGRQVKESSWDNKVDSLNISGNNREKSLTTTPPVITAEGTVNLDGFALTDADRKAIWAKVEENLKKPRDEQDIVEIRDRNNSKVIEFDEQCGMSTAVKSEDSKRVIYELYAYRTQGGFRFRRIGCFESKELAEKCMRDHYDEVISNPIPYPIYDKAVIMEVAFGWVSDTMNTLWFYQVVAEVLDSNPPQYRGKLASTVPDNDFPIWRLIGEPCVK